MGDFCLKLHLYFLSGVDCQYSLGQTHTNQIMSSKNLLQPSIPKFDGHYDFWSMMMENFLRSKEIWSLVEDGIPTPIIGSGRANEVHRKSVEEAKLKDLRVKNFLF